MVSCTMGFAAQGRRSSPVEVPRTAARESMKSFRARAWWCHSHEPCRAGCPLPPVKVLHLFPSLLHVRKGPRTPQSVKKLVSMRAQFPQSILFSPGSGHSGNVTSVEWTADEDNIQVFASSSTVSSPTDMFCLCQTNPSRFRVAEKVRFHYSGTQHFNVGLILC